MFCPECESEYREGFVRCNDCDVALVEDLSALTGTEAIASNLVSLTQSRSSEYVADLIERLEKASIPYVIEAGTALALLEGEREDLGARLEWSARVWVAAWMIEDAQTLLDALRAEVRAQPGASPDS